MKPRSKAGLTLMEVVVALAISGMVLVGARQILQAVTDSSRRISQSASEHDRVVNGERLLRSLLRRAEAGTPGTIPFRGDRAALWFSSWCDVAGGWQERCRVDLAIPRKDGRHMLYLGTSTGLSLVLRDGVASGGIRYLESARGGGTWYPNWTSELTVPLGIELVIDHDTIFVRIGERG